MDLIDTDRVSIAGSRAAVIGRSNIVGKPVAMMLMARNATVTVCHSQDSGSRRGGRPRADIVVAAIGRAGFVKGSWIQPGAVVIDVGINRTPEGKLAGDVDFEAAKERAGAITPVPGRRRPHDDRAAPEEHREGGGE